MESEILIGTIEYALNKVMAEYENADDEHEKLIYELLKRSKALLNNIKIYGIQTCGMTYEQFCELLENKKNIIFFTDENLDKFNKALKIVDILNERN